MTFKLVKYMSNVMKKLFLPIIIIVVILASCCRGGWEIAVIEVSYPNIAISSPFESYQNSKK